MGFFYSQDGKGTAPRQPPTIPIEALKKSGCRACPMDKDGMERHHAKMTAWGSSSPLVYILGEAPGKNEDEEGQPFVGESGALLRSLIPRDLRDQVRIHNSVRCRPPKNRDPQLVELECCRGYIEDDIIAAKPVVIIGTGNTPLQWATGRTGVTRYRGRLLPIKVGSHVCWFYSVFHPASILHKRGRRREKIPEQIALEHDLRDIFERTLSNQLGPPPFYTDGFGEGVVVITDYGQTGLEKLEKELEITLSLTHVGLDLETIGLRPYNTDSTILTAAVGSFDRTVAFPLDHPQGWNSSYRRKVWSLFTDWLLTSGVKVAHNLKFEQEWLAQFIGPDLLFKTDWDDTMAQAHTLDERVGLLKLGDLTLLHFGFDVKKTPPVIDTSRILQYPLKDVLLYNGKDTKWEDRLYWHFKTVLDQSPGLKAEWNRKVRLTPHVTMAQYVGVLADIEFAQRKEQEINKEITKTEDRLFGTPEVREYERRNKRKFQPTSTDDSAELYRDILRRKEGERKGDSGQVVGYTTDEAALSLMPVREVPSAPLLLLHRELSKIKSTYLTPVTSGQIVYPDGRLHTSYNSMVAETGRLSSSDPNLQNQPKRKHKDIRGVIVPPPGSWLVAADYGQIEARVIAMYSEDKKLMEYMWSSYDIHTVWTKRIAQKHPVFLDRIAFEFDLQDEDKIWKQARDETKNNFVFASFYGAVPYSIAQNMQLPIEIAEAVQREFWQDEFPGVKRWQDRVIKKYAEKGYLELFGGRRRRGPLTERQIINTHSQGTASDIVVDAWCRLGEAAYKLDQPWLWAVLNIHDDLTFTLPDPHLEDGVQTIGVEMCRPVFNYIIVPLVVEISVSKTRWSNMEEVAKFRSDQYHDHK